VHEPPLLGMLAGTRFEPVLQEVNRRAGAVVELLQTGEDEGGAKQFVETVAWHPGAWEEELTPGMRDVFTNNAPTFLDEAHDPGWRRIDLDRLSRFGRPALLTKGTVSRLSLQRSSTRSGRRCRSLGSKRSRARITRRTRPPPNGTST
jgi:hypothetical protein